MAFVFADGFDLYAATADLAKKWYPTLGSAWAWNGTAGRNGGGAAVATTTGATTLRIRQLLNYVYSSTTFISMAFWIKVSAAPASASAVINVILSGGSAWGTVRIDTSGRLTMYNTSNSLIATGTTNICDDAWHWVELYLGSDSGSTHHRYWVDGALDLSVGSNSWTTFNTIETVEFVSITSRTVTIDDVIFWDNTGSGLIRTSHPINPRVITTVRPTADTADKDFARSTGSDNYALIDEVNADTADYVENGTSGDQDLYAYGNLGFTPTAVTGVVVNAYLHNPGGGTLNHQFAVKSSSTTTLSTSTVTPSSARVLQAAYLTDPNGSIAWTGTAVDAATIGIKVP